MEHSGVTCHAFSHPGSFTSCLSLLELHVYRAFPPRRVPLAVQEHMRSMRKEMMVLLVGGFTNSLVNRVVGGHTKKDTIKFDAVVCCL